MINSRPAGKRRYLILRKGCLYYFANETANAAKGQFILTGHALPEIYVHRALSCVPCGTSVCCTSWSSLRSTMSLSRQRMTFLVVAGRSHAWMGSVIGLWLHHRAIDISYIVAPSGWTKRAPLPSPSSPGQGWVGEVGGAVGEVETSWY